jgi:S1-C subfamily serine protease
VYITSLALQRVSSPWTSARSARGGERLIWDKQGRLVTNFHVVEAGDRFSVTLSDQSEWPAKVIGTAPDKDLAVLQIEAPTDRLVPMTIGRSATSWWGRRCWRWGTPSVSTTPSPPGS